MPEYTTEVGDFKFVIRVQPVRPNEKVLARINLRVVGLGEFKGYIVLKSKFDDGIRVSDPTAKSDRGNRRIRFIYLDENIWFELKEHMLQAYKEWKEVFKPYLSKSEDDIDPDEIPI